MRIKYLQQFITLSQVKNHQKAADALYISQPHPPKHIRRFSEIVLGKRLPFGINPGLKRIDKSAFYS